jgi:anti-sigma regulatory factor (Ser/Thr protein kinase)
LNIILKANKKELYMTLNSFEECLTLKNISEEIKLVLRMILEEILINIVIHGYKVEDENNIIKIESIFEKNPLKIIIKFIDKGIPFNPLSLKDPDITLDSDDREIGGLGIFLVKENVDNISYEFKDNQNILTVEKIIN